MWPLIIRLPCIKKSPDFSKLMIDQYVYGEFCYVRRFHDKVFSVCVPIQWICTINIHITLTLYSVFFIIMESWLTKQDITTCTNMEHHFVSHLSRICSHFIYPLYIGKPMKQIVVQFLQGEPYQLQVRFRISIKISLLMWTRHLKCILFPWRNMKFYVISAAL